MKNYCFNFSVVVAIKFLNNRRAALPPAFTLCTHFANNVIYFSYIFDENDRCQKLIKENIASEQWTLITGNDTTRRYAVCARPFKIEKKNLRTRDKRAAVVYTRVIATHCCKSCNFGANQACK